MAFPALNVDVQSCRGKGNIIVLFSASGFQCSFHGLFWHHRTERLITSLSGPQDWERDFALSWSKTYQPWASHQACFSVLDLWIRNWGSNHIHSNHTRQRRWWKYDGALTHGVSWECFYWADKGSRLIGETQTTRSIFPLIQRLCHFSVVWLCPSGAASQRIPHYIIIFWNV